MDRKYNLKLDLQFRCNNSVMKFRQSDNKTSDFFMRITNGGNLVDIEKAIVVLATIKPSGKVASQFVEVENGLVYADLKTNMKDEIGIYAAKAMLILEDERVVTDVISYEVEEDKIFSLLNDTAEATEEFTLLTDMLSRLSNIEISEEQRVINEAERILSEENRKIEEAKRVEAELIRQHEEADRAKYDATRESNENIRKQNESIRLANETNRIDEEAKRVEEENKRKLAEEGRNANYNFMTEDEERRRLEANAHKEAEVLRVQAETNRVNEEAKRRTTEQARVSAENTRVSNENTRKSNEIFRENNETQRIEAETQRQNRYNSFITEAEANANNFENYTNTVKVKEEERKSNELDRKSQETKRVSNEVERISNENTRKANEVTRIESEKQRVDAENLRKEKIIEIQSDYDSLKKVIIDENVSANLQNQINQTNSQLEQKTNEIFNNQEDFIETIKRNYSPKNMHFFVNDIENKIFSIRNIIDDDYAIQYSTRQPSLNSELDGYVLIGEGRYGEIRKQPAITHRLPADSLTGEWDKTYPPSYYAKSLGATMTKTFTGERIDFFHFADDRGGIWEFVLDGDEENAVTYSVWDEVSGAKGPFVLFDNLENKQHTLVATFKGDDPKHPPSSGVGTSRGWSYYNEGENNINSFYIYIYHDNVTPIATPLYGSSNKEFAISSRKKGTTHPFHFCPYHDAITSFQVEPPKIKIDGEEKELSTRDYFKNVSEIKIIQHINAKNPESSEILAEIFTTTTFKDDGTITVDGKYEAKTDLDIDSAYGIMWMIDADFNTKICSSINKTYLTSDAQIGTNLYLTDESDKTTSFISVSKDFPDICTAVTFNNPKSTLRSGMNKKVDKCTWIEYRDGGILTKLYQQVYGKTSIDAGEVFRFSGTFIVGKVENIYNLI